MIGENEQAAGLRKSAISPPMVVRLRGDIEDAARVIAVTSGKGGVGKTQVAANIAVGLASRGRRVLILDADLGLASLDLALGLSPRSNLLSVLTGERTIDEIIVPGPADVHLIPACPGRYDVANLDAAQRGRLWDLVEQTALKYDVLVIDTGAGIGSNAVGFASYADDIVLVTTPDPTALRDAYAMAKSLHRRANIDRVHLVANQVRNEREGAQLHRQMNSIVKRFLSLELAHLGSIPVDAVVREAVALGEPFLLRSPSAGASTALDNIVRRLVELHAREGGARC